MTAAVVHLDWSHDSELLMANTRAYDLKFCNVNNHKVTTSSAAKEQKWHTWTCKLGWATQGIFVTDDENDVTTVCRTKSEKLLATGGKDGKINLFKYPSVQEKSDFKSYRGHSSEISEVRFTEGDSNLVTIGKKDRSIILWETDFEDFKGYELEDDKKFQKEPIDIDKLDKVDVSIITEGKLNE